VDVGVDEVDVGVDEVDVGVDEVDVGVDEVDVGVDEGTLVVSIQLPELRVYPSRHSVGIHSMSSFSSYVFLTASSTSSTSVGIHLSPSPENILGFANQYAANPSRPNSKNTPSIRPMFGELVDLEGAI
jgi:hypothetical protein